MKNLKIFIIQSALDKPLLFRAVIFLFGVIVGVTYPWYGNRDVMTLSLIGAGLLFGFSLMVYTFMFALYRIVQSLFRRGRKLPDRIRDYDERELLKILGLFWFLPFGISLHLISQLSAVNESNFGTNLIIHGLSITLATKFSQIIKNEITTLYCTSQALFLKQLTTTLNNTSF